MRKTVEEKSGVKFLYNFRRSALYGYGRIQAGSVLRTQPLSAAVVRDQGQTEEVQNQIANRKVGVSTEVCANVQKGNDGGWAAKI